MAEKAAALVKALFPHPSPKGRPANPEEACVTHSHFLKLWLVERLNKKTATSAWKTDCNGKLTVAEINLILNCIAEIRHFPLRKWRNMKTGENTHPSVLEVMATMRGQQPGKGTPEKKQPGKGTPEKKKSNPKKMAALPVAQTETVEPENWTPTKRLPSKTSPILMVSAEELSGVGEDEVLSVLIKQLWHSCFTAACRAACESRSCHEEACNRQLHSSEKETWEPAEGCWPQKLQETCKPAKGCLEAKR